VQPVIWVNFTGLVEGIHKNRNSPVASFTVGNSRLLIIRLFFLPKLPVKSELNMHLRGIKNKYMNNCLKLLSIKNYSEHKGSKLS
jgi:hypothetical protein